MPRSSTTSHPTAIPLRKCAKSSPNLECPMSESRRYQFTRAKLVRLTSTSSIIPKIPFFSRVQLVKRHPPLVLFHMYHFSRTQLANLTSAEKKPHGIYKSPLCPSYRNVPLGGYAGWKFSLDWPILYDSHIGLSVRFTPRHMRSEIRHCVHHVENALGWFLGWEFIPDFPILYETRICLSFSSHAGSAIWHCAHHIEMSF